MATSDLVVKVRADTSEIDRQLAESMWKLFLLWERDAANKGSGLTKDQITGARVYHDWLNRTDKG